MSAKWQVPHEGRRTEARRGSGLRRGPRNDLLLPFFFSSSFFFARRRRSSRPSTLVLLASVALASISAGALGVPALASAQTPPASPSDDAEPSPTAVSPTAPPPTVASGSGSSAAAPNPGDSVSVDPRAFLDSTALTVFTAARRRQLESDSTIQSYEAVRRQRFSVRLRTPLRDRTLYHAEAASRIWWSPDGAVEQYLASRETTPDGVEPPGELLNISEIFDPAASPYSRNDGIAGEGREEIERDREGEGDDGDGDDDVDVSVSVDAQDFIGPGSEEHYRFRTADSLTVTLPDGRLLRTIALEVIPRERSGRLGSGLIWIEPESGALVRSVSRLSTAFDFEEQGVFDEIPEMRLVPGIFRPIQFDVSLIVVEYSLWDFRHWMRRRVRIEGSVRAGVVNVPAVLEETYQILDVTAADGDGATDSRAGGGPEPGDEAESETAAAVAQRWQAEERYGDYRLVEEDGDEDEEEEEEEDEKEGEKEKEEDEEEEGEEEAGKRLDDPIRIVLAPADSTRLHDSQWLPPPVWEEAPGFTGDEAREEFSEILASLQIPPPAPRGVRFTWGYQGSDLLRYNRVEGFSLGARGRWTPPFSPAPDELSLTGRLGVGTWVPDGTLELVWTGPERTISLAGHHSVTPVDPGTRSLGLGNSTSALLFGRDDGDYFRATGGRLSFGPGERDRPWYEIHLSAEEQRPLPVEASFSVFGGPFRPGLDAERLREYRAGIRVSPSWGYDPFGVQGGAEILAEHGEGDRSWTRAGATGRLSVPLFAELRGAVEVGGGHVWGDPPVQRHWFLGGTRTLRGYVGGAAVGRTYGRVRADLSWGSPAGRLSIFGDAGWAGDPDLYHRDDILVAAGAGLSLLDGLLRVDLARALRTRTGWRLELHLDSFH